MHSHSVLEIEFPVDLGTWQHINTHCLLTMSNSYLGLHKHCYELVLGAGPIALAIVVHILGGGGGGDLTTNDPFSNLLFLLLLNKLLK
jgi:hypothetical protein